MAGYRITSAATLLGLAISANGAFHLADVSLLAQAGGVVSAALQEQLLVNCSAPSGECNDLRALYGPTGSPVWTDGAGRLTHSAHIALSLFTNAAAEGLDPRDYLQPELTPLDRALDAGPASPRAIAAVDVGLSRAMLRLLGHLRYGRVAPREAGFSATAPRDDLNIVAVLRDALSGNRLAAAYAEAAPPLAQYRQLRAALARYRALGSRADLAPLHVTAAVVKPGDAYTQGAALHAWLLVMGDVPAESRTPVDPVYSDDLVSGVKRFQTRHGLTSDGVIGPATREALHTLPARRVRQIELAMERLRWVSGGCEGRLIAVNIPMFTLWAWDDATRDGPAALALRVVVGRARRTQTPRLIGGVTSLVLGPYWNVPRSILLGEILPAIARDPDYLVKHDMELVAGPSDASPVVPATAANLARLRGGTLRIRQRPGPQNALGLVKFVFPNPQGVYLHGSPARALFDRPRRDFSHGCVRVDDPVALAEWALAEFARWPAAEIRAAAERYGARTLELGRPIQILLWYLTAAVDPSDGTVRFAEDIYGLDAQLERALARDH
jgi:murein L,D-transpeptidase YcbB/YkuD